MPAKVEPGVNRAPHPRAFPADQRLVNRLQRARLRAVDGTGQICCRSRLLKFGMNCGGIFGTEDHQGLGVPN